MDGNAVAKDTGRSGPDLHEAVSDQLVDCQKPFQPLIPSLMMASGMTHGGSSPDSELMPKRNLFVKTAAGSRPDPLSVAMTSRVTTSVICVLHDHSITGPGYHSSGPLISRNHPVCISLKTLMGKTSYTPLPMYANW
jgi:hypothetical protein